MKLESINPANGEKLAAFDELSSAKLETKIGAAFKAFRSWRQTSFAERAAILNIAADVLISDKEHWARLMTLEMGKTLPSAVGEVEKCAAGCRYYAENDPKFLADETTESDTISRICYLPFGVVLAVMPWNFPFWQVFRFLAPALMAGNVGLLKHASNVPQCAIAIETIMRRAGLPDGAFQTLLIGSKKVADVIRDPRVAAVTLTGSEAAGENVANVAGSALKKCVLELGGSDPFVVLPSADLEQAVETGVKARMMNNGQSCICAKRFIVHSEVYAEFEKRFISAVGRLSVGDPIKNDTDVGPLATPDGIKTLERQV